MTVPTATGGEGVGVRVPASSANLGPGFDALAVALDVHLVAWTVTREERRVISEGEGADELPSDERNRIWEGFAAWCNHVGAVVPDLSIRTRTHVPLERGMGSSSAAVVAGLGLGRALTGGGSDADLIRLAAHFDGHADNAAAAVLGGLVVCVDGTFRRFDPTDALRPVVCIPTARQSTDLARGLVPATIATADAAANGARAALVVAGLTGAGAFDPRAMTDAIHEPPRLAAMAGSGALVEALRAGGIGACLSGAGPTVLAITTAGDEAAVAQIRDLAGEGWDVRATGWDRTGLLTCPPAEALAALG